MNHQHLRPNRQRTGTYVFINVFFSVVADVLAQQLVQTSSEDLRVSGRGKGEIGEQESQGGEA